MIDSVYRNSFSEVYQILLNTDPVLLKKVPEHFISFLKNNMNTDFYSNLDINLEIDKQSLLPETENILSLIFRSYWATDEEKIELTNNDKQQLAEFQNNIDKTYKDIDEIFDKKKRKNINNITLNDNLIVIQKENFILKFFKKFLNIFKK